MNPSLGHPLSRRAFAATGLGLAGSLLRPRPLQAAALGGRSPNVDGARVNGILESLQEFGGTGDGGTTRLAYSDQDLAARDFVRGLMEDAGLSVSVDLAGNLVGRREGRRGDRSPIVIGSHIDSVPQGGSYDGQVGTAGALEVALSLRDQGIDLDHPLEVMVFQNEEGGKTGSRGTRR